MPRMFQPQRYGDSTPGRPVVRILLGSAALACLAFGLIGYATTPSSDHGYESAPACPNLLTGPDCRGEILVEVIGVDAELTGTEPTESLYLTGSTPEIGWVDLDLHGDASLGRGIHVHDEVVAEIWHDKAVAVTANGRTVRVIDVAVSTRQEMLFILIAAELVAFPLLRSAGRARLWRLLGHQPRRGPEHRLMRTFEVAVAAVGIGGTALLLVSIPWGVTLVGIASAALLYGLVRPALTRRTLFWFSGSGGDYQLLH